MKTLLVVFARMFAIATLITTMIKITMIMVGPEATFSTMVLGNILLAICMSFLVCLFLIGGKK